MTLEQYDKLRSGMTILDERGWKWKVIGYFENHFNIEHKGTTKCFYRAGCEHWRVKDD